MLVARHVLACSLCLAVKPTSHSLHRPPAWNAGLQGLEQLARHVGGWLCVHALTEPPQLPPTPHALACDYRAIPQSPPPRPTVFAHPPTRTPTAQPQIESEVYAAGGNSGKSPREQEEVAQSVGAVPPSHGRHAAPGRSGGRDTDAEDRAAAAAAGPLGGVGGGLCGIGVGFKQHARCVEHSNNRAVVVLLGSLMRTVLLALGDAAAPAPDLCLSLSPPAFRRTPHAAVGRPHRKAGAPQQGPRRGGRPAASARRHGLHPQQPCGAG